MAPFQGTPPATARLVGSALSAPKPPGGRPGIPGVVGMLELVAQELGRLPAPVREGMNPYQAGLWELYGSPAGPEAVLQRLVRRAVLMALSLRFHTSRSPTTRGLHPGSRRAKAGT
jgi:hypothetical protein